jgi:hypothetical protein
MFGMSDHEVLQLVVIFGIVHFIADLIWKVFGTQRRLNVLERKVFGRVTRGDQS